MGCQGRAVSGRTKPGSPALQDQDEQRCSDMLVLEFSILSGTRGHWHVQNWVAFGFQVFRTSTRATVTALKIMVKTRISIREKYWKESD